MIAIGVERRPEDLQRSINHLFERSAEKIDAIERTWNPTEGAPVFTVDGRYRTRGWTEWTQGFQFGSAILQYDAAGGREFLELGRSRTLERMAPHLTHIGVHDHGFNNVSTYGNLWRLSRERRFDAPDAEIALYELALKVSGAVQAARWTKLAGGGFIHSFNGPHSLFVDTIRTLRALALSHVLGHTLLEEQDARVSLRDRLLQHARATAEYSVYYGRGRDAYDVRGRVAHESLFNVVSGSYRGPNSQQGYSSYTTWTRGLAWAMLGFAEQLEFLESIGSADETLVEAAAATCDYYIAAACSDGIPYWDTGAPGLASLGDWNSRPADPFNDVEPVDSSAAAIAAQGLLRFGRFLSERGQSGSRYTQAGLLVLETLFDPSGPYVSQSPRHEGLLLHAIYHRPNGWDYVPAGSRIPRGESCMWGDYHAREAALYVMRLSRGPYLTFFGPERVKVSA